MTKSWRLVNADLIAREAKYTFYKPSQKVIDKLSVGNFCKLIFKFDSNDPEEPSAERMWVIIEAIENGKFTGRLDNEPLYIKDLQLNDLVQFEAIHIIDLDVDDDEPSIVETYLNRCIETRRIIYQNAKIGYLYREDPMEGEIDGFKDSGWRFMEGGENQDYVDNPDNLQFISLRNILNSDNSFISLLDNEIGSEYIRDEETGDFVLLK